MAKLTKTQFITAILPHVLQVRKEGSPMFPSVRIAQNLLETGGKIHDWNNLGGIKVGSGKPNEYWKGKSTFKGTWEDYGAGREETAAYFRVYDTLYDFYKDQDLLFHLSRYDRVRVAKTPEEQAEMLRACGYATDPKYASKIISIINANGLRKYDGEDEYLMKPADANKIIDDYLRPARAAALKLGNKKKAEEAHVLSNELRKASGQKEQ